MRVLQTNQKKEGDFLIKAFFNEKTDKPNRIDVERKVPFTFNDTEVEETAILRFKDNHKKGEIYTIETIFAHMLIDKVYCPTGYATFPSYNWDPLPPSKYRMHPTLKTIWKDPVNDRHINDFMILFNNFHLFIKKDCIVEFKYSSLLHYAHQIYETYKKEKEDILHLQNKSEIHSRLIGGFYAR